MGGRITPACAGNRYTHCYPLTKIKDHPRVCGEQASVKAFNLHMGGSPPRVRGTGIFGTWWKMYLRITPACAGNSFLCVIFNNCF